MADAENIAITKAEAALGHSETATKRNPVVLEEDGEPPHKRAAQGSGDDVSSQRKPPRSKTDVKFPLYPSSSSFKPNTIAQPPAKETLPRAGPSNSSSSAVAASPSGTPSHSFNSLSIGRTPIRLSPSVEDARYAALCGLDNMGNTCYLNSVLQCLRFLPLMSECLNYTSLLDKVPFSVDNHPLLLRWQLLMEDMADAEKSHRLRADQLFATRTISLAPTSFKHELGVANALFDSFMQQDAQECLRFLLNHLQEAQEAALQPASVPSSADGQQAEAPTALRRASLPLLPSSSLGRPVELDHEPELTDASASLSFVDQADLDMLESGPFGDSQDEYHNNWLQVQKMETENAPTPSDSGSGSRSNSLPDIDLQASALAPEHEYGAATASTVVIDDDEDANEDDDEEDEGNNGDEAGGDASSNGVVDNDGSDTSRSDAADKTDFAIRISSAESTGRDEGSISQQRELSSSVENAILVADASGSLDDNIVQVDGPMTAPIAHQASSPPDSSAEPKIPFTGSLFEGHMLYTTRCLTCDARSDRREAFHDISIPVPSEPQTLKACLAQLFGKRERMVGADKIFCEQCQAKQEATREMSVADLPPVLTLHLNRSDHLGAKASRCLTLPPILQQQNNPVTAIDYVAPSFIGGKQPTLDIILPWFGVQSCSMRRKAGLVRHCCVIKQRSKQQLRWRTGLGLPCPEGLLPKS
ncbi:uncharacterized protein MONBRDRAFT_27754 [Monosiga brevicollis MX1]|uniref:USP domain-containing protein n=1 Tax=Monosiga brevicollis TaxID=81824 RepID=A9V678_MONBE|nr:uncharacterized protein MONBRDRAFT_27754 [Monosiga brevicollis MX1]EDQ86941.1 predicted protein [Monosiga brevicollis MX1]|eukprot:XP_001748180.1 hypothetical protein [Monosiga brevicollis MX1]